MTKNPNPGKKLFSFFFCSDGGGVCMCVCVGGWKGELVEVAGSCKYVDIDRMIIHDDNP